MKKILLLLLPLLLTDCSSVRMVDSWKNEEVVLFQPKKLLVIGVTDNLTARRIFEEKFKNELLERNINAVESTAVFDISFTDSKRSEEEIDKMIAGLSEKGFDAVLISAVKGIDERTNYRQGYYAVDYYWTRFGRYYYTYQDIYYHPGYYDEYNIYHVETSIYNINEASDKSLIWVGAANIVDPDTIKETVNHYVATLLKRLEEDNVLPRP